MVFLSTKEYNRVENLAQTVDKKNMEFEAIFYDITPERKRNFFIKELDFKRVLSNILLLSKNKLKLEQSLHVVYMKMPRLNYRIEINGEANIKKYITLLGEHNKNVIFKSLLSIVDEDDNVTLTKKSIQDKNIINIDNHGIRFRLAQEEQVTKKELEMLNNIGFIEGKEVVFRLRQRISYFVEKTKDFDINVDLTFIQMHHSLQKIPYVPGKYEVEIDAFKLNNGKPKDTKFIDIMAKYAAFILKIIQQSNILISFDTRNTLRDKYINLVYNKKIKINRMQVRQAFTLGITNAVKDLPNNYALTDKADGIRHFAYIVDDKVFIIDSTLTFKATDIKVNGNYNNTIIDGEYIFLRDKKKYVYMAFDILFYKGENIQNNPKMHLIERIKKLDDVVDNAFGSKIPHNFTSFKKFDELKDFYTDEINKYLTHINNDIDNSNNVIVRRKFYIFPKGIDSSEIFFYAKIMWGIFQTSKFSPYHLDGLIFTPIYDKYFTPRYNKRLKILEGRKEFKWKPNYKLSIDFYIRFKRDSKTDKIFTVFDNTRENSEGELYHICYLYVSRRNKNDDSEEPVEFLSNIEKNYTYIPLKDGYPRDINGDVITDDTIVEFIYDDERDEYFRWVPIGTRYDKTDFMIKNKKKFGNGEAVAYDNWEVINNNLSIDDFQILGNTKQFKIYKEKLLRRIEVLDEETFYQRQSNIALPMRRFHNWIKSNMIYMYCKPDLIEHGSQSKVIQKTVLDIAVGQGGDINKYINTGISLLVGVDVDKKGLEKKNGAIDRYNDLKESKRGLVKLYRNEIHQEIKDKFPKMEFIHADAGNLFTYKDQLSRLSTMSDANKKAMITYFEDAKFNKYDVVNCYFAMHFFFDNQTRMDNFFANVSMHLKKDGFFMCTLFDAEKVLEKFQNNDTFKVSYTNQTGEIITMFQINKLFPQDKLEDIKIGAAIDVYNSIYSSSNKFIKEYLVNKDHFVPYVKEKYGLRLIETDLFENVYNSNKSLFRRMKDTETNRGSKDYFDTIWKLYESDDEIDVKSREWMKLNRYYVFQKIVDESKKVVNTHKIIEV